MCDPVSIAGVGLSMVGSFANAREQARNQARMVSARNEAALAEQQRQRAYADEGRSTQNQTLDRFTSGRQSQALGQATASRTASNTAAVTRPDYGTESTAPSVVKGEIARKVGEAVSKGRAQAGALARLGAYQDQGFGNRVALARGGNQLGNINSFSAGSAQLLPLEQQAAAINAQRSPSGFGDALMLAGSAAGMAGARGWNPFAGSGTPTQLMPGVASSAGPLSPASIARLAPTTPPGITFY